MINVKIKKLHTDALMPQYGSDGAACFDLNCIGCAYVDSYYVFETGLAFEIPEGRVMLVFSRSGHGFNNDIRLANCVGVIDHDYRGEVKVKLRCDSLHGGLAVKRGDRIAQAMIIPYQKVGFVWADELSDTDRGAGGFGSTGA